MAVTAAAATAGVWLMITGHQEAVNRADAGTQVASTAPGAGVSGPDTATGAAPEPAAGPVAEPAVPPPNTGAATAPAPAASPSAASPSAALPPAPVLPETQIPVLMYHDIAPGPNNLHVPPAELAAHLAYLKQEGYNPVTLQQVYDNFNQGRRLPPKPIVLTFDDGYISFYTNAWPLLQQHQAPATLFVITGFVGKPGYVTWEQVRAMAGAGIEMGAHTVNHPDLRVVRGEALYREVAESRRVLQERSGQAVHFFAYPAGKYDDRTLAALKESGYLGSVTTQPGAATPCQDSLQWRRTRINPGVTARALGAMLRRAADEAAREAACQVAEAPPHH